jgi:hypothetical protein
MAKDNAFEMDYPGVAGQMSILVVDPFDPATPNNVIETADPWQINVDWEISGPTAGLMGGTWFVTAYLDDRDGEATFSGRVADTIEVKVNTAPSAPLPRKYSTVISVPAGKVTPGLYDLTVAILYENTGAPGTDKGIKHPVAGFSDGPILEFYTTDTP